MFGGRWCDCLGGAESCCEVCLRGVKLIIKENKMLAREIFEAEDGTYFYTEGECFRYEELEMRIDVKTNAPVKCSKREYDPWRIRYL